jgi:hypothetical protein
MYIASGIFQQYDDGVFVHIIATQANIAMEVV